MIKMDVPFDHQRFNVHILPAIHKCIDELALKLKSVAQRLRRGKKQHKDEKIAKLNEAKISDDNSLHSNNNQNSVKSDNHEISKNSDDAVNNTVLMANSVGYRQLIINILRLISYIYRTSNLNINYENVNSIIQNGNIDFLLLKKISVPLIHQLFNLYHTFGTKFQFISRRKKVSDEMKTIMSHSTIAMNFLFKLIFEISPCDLITVLYMYIQNDEYTKTCCSILRDHLIPYITKCSRLRHEQLVYEMRLRQMIIDKDYMQLFDILRLDIERMMYRKFPLPHNVNNCLRSLYVVKFHMYKRNTSHIHYFESEEAVQLMSKKVLNATLIVFIRGMCVFVFDVVKLHGENLEEKNWAERLELYRPHLNERCQEIIKVTEIHESELDDLVRRPTYVYIKTCGFGLGTFFENFHKYEKKGRRVPITDKLPRDSASFMLHDSEVRGSDRVKRPVVPLDSDYDIVDQL